MPKTSLVLLHVHMKMLLNVEYAVKQGYTKVSIRIVDMDVIVLVVAAVECLNIDELRVAFGTLSSSQVVLGIGA